MRARPGIEMALRGVHRILSGAGEGETEEAGLIAIG